MKPVISQAEAIRRMEQRKPFIALIMLALCVAVLIGLLSMCSKPSGSNRQAPHISREQILNQAKSKFDAGDGFGALEIIDKNSTSEMLRTDEEIRVLKRTIIASMNADIAPQRAEPLCGQKICSISYLPVWLKKSPPPKLSSLTLYLAIDG
ncbi:hypothetical protein [Asticcacaulis sp.]|uniref:hypothetical protein n=1 Tax=Asticcacaulis sp. TaxID=1872648 RepID=UPI002B612A36|nr:hypothetical protein [Asticcacaulis sp.]HTM80196.1 hypothetical protein [Asticcacaulis sp.]